MLNYHAIDCMMKEEQSEKAAAALQESERRLAQAQRIAHVGDWEWEVATNAVHWSEELYRIYGFEPFEIEPDYSLVLEQMHPDSKKEFLQAIDAALADDKHFEMDYTFFRKDGTEAILHTIGQVFRDTGGNPARMAGVVQDITEQKRAEIQLQNSEEKFRTIFNKANDGILIADAETRIFLEANQTICRMLGYNKKELFKMGVADIHPQESVAAVQKAFEQLKRTEISRAENIPVKRKDGTIFYADINSTLIKMDNKPCLVGIFHDISERKQTEEKLRLNEMYIRNVLDSVDEGFIVIDHDYRIHTANRAYCNQVGLPLAQVLGKTCYELSHKRSSPCHEEGEECSVREVFQTGNPCTAYHRHFDDDGDVIYVETKAFPLKDLSGNTIRVIETVNNITEKHLLEEERLKSQKLESIGTLAGGIAHDFNNLLQGVFGYISMAKLSSRENDETRSLLQEAEQALKLAVQLTNQLLTFSKGGKPIKEIADITPVIKNAVKFALSGSKTDYNLDLADDLWMAEIDRGQLFQVIQNIILNADEAMVEGGTVRISTQNETIKQRTKPDEIKESEYIRIEIKDSGKGIPEEHQSRIFDPYFTTKEKGSGLGLATTYSIINNHGGTIDVSSEKGQGCTFVIRLPATATIREESRASDTKNDAPSKKAKVLMMDDDEMVREVSKRMFDKLGHTVGFASDGEQAVELFQKARKASIPFDIVLLDLTVRGGMGGKETLQKLVTVDPDVIAVVSSGYSDNSVMSNFHQHGFSAMLMKPYSIEDLQDCLENLID